MKKSYYLLLIPILIISTIGIIYLTTLFSPQPIYLQSVYTSSPPDIDGDFNATEWNSAFSISISLIGSWETRQGEIHILNNDTHLFFAFRVFNEDYDGPPYPEGDPDELWIWLDPNNNGELDSYEDIKRLYTSPTLYTDLYHTTPIGGLFVYADSVHGGTTDGSAAWNHTNPAGNGILTFETLFPFVSSDPNDINVTRGATIGIMFEFYSLTTISHYFLPEWPADKMKPAEWAKLTLA